MPTGFVLVGIKNNNNNNNKFNNVDGAIIMKQVISGVHQGPLMNVDQRKATSNPQTKPNNLGCESASRLLSTYTVYYYSAQKLTLILPSHGGRRLS